MHTLPMPSPGERLRSCCHQLQGRTRLSAREAQRAGWRGLPQRSHGGTDLLAATPRAAAVMTGRPRRNHPAAAGGDHLACRGRLGRGVAAAEPACRLQTPAVQKRAPAPRRASGSGGWRHPFSGAPVAPAPVTAPPPAPPLHPRRTGRRQALQRTCGRLGAPTSTAPPAPPAPPAPATSPRAMRTRTFKEEHPFGAGARGAGASVPGRAPGPIRPPPAPLRRRAALPLAGGGLVGPRGAPDAAAAPLARSPDAARSRPLPCALACREAAGGGGAHTRQVPRPHPGARGRGGCAGWGAVPERCCCQVAAAAALLDCSAPLPVHTPRR